MPARPISVRLPEAMIAAMDEHLADAGPDGSVRTRTDLIQAAIDLWLRADETARVDAEIDAAYTRQPLDHAADAALVRAADEAQGGTDPW
ncbi:MAG: hypothetical protein ACKO7U_05735 [Actinomycetota bacterium]